MKRQITLISCCLAIALQAPAAQPGGVKALMPEVIRQVQKGLTDQCVGSNNPSYSVKHPGGEPIYGGLNPGGSVLSALLYPHGIRVPGDVQTVLTLRPKHGTLEMIGIDARSFPGASYQTFKYIPEKSFLGEDRAAFEVTAAGSTFRVSYLIKVVDWDPSDACETEGDGESGGNRQSNDIALNKSASNKQFQPTSNAFGVCRG